MRLFGYALFVMLAAYGTAVGYLYNLQARMIFPGPAGVDREFLDAVAARVDADVLAIPTAAGETLYGWHRKGFGHEERRVVLYFHGNASSVLAQLELQQQLLERGWDFVGVHYRGYPGSSGTPTEAGVYEDARASWRFITDTLGARPERIAIHGRSLGGGVAVKLASEVGPAAIVLESTFTSLVDVASHHYPWLPVKRLLAHRFESDALADKLNCDVLVLHGTADRTIPVDNGRALAKLIPSATYIEVPGRDHNDPLIDGDIARRYLDFLDQATR